MSKKDADNNLIKKLASFLLVNTQKLYWMLSLVTKL